MGGRRHSGFFRVARFVAVIAALGLLGASCGNPTNKTTTVRGRFTVPEGVAVYVAPQGEAALPSISGEEQWHRPSSGWFLVEPDGSFCWKGVGQGTLGVRIAIDRVEQKTLTLPTINVGSGQDLAPTEWSSIRLADLVRTYHVKVLDANRVPVEGAVVVCEPIRDQGLEKTTDAHGLARIFSIDPEPQVGAFRSAKNGNKGSRPKVVTAKGDVVEIVLDERIPLNVDVDPSLRLPPQRSFFARVCPINPAADPVQDLGPNTRVSETPAEYSWTQYVSSGDWIDRQGKATIGLPWPGHYAMILYVAQTGDSDLRIRVQDRWTEFSLEDVSSQALHIAATQAEVDEALKRLEELSRELAEGDKK